MDGLVVAAMSMHAKYLQASPSKPASLMPSNPDPVITMQNMLQAGQNWSRGFADWLQLLQQQASAGSSIPKNLAATHRTAGQAKSAAGPKVQTKVKTAGAQTVKPATSRQALKPEPETAAIQQLQQEFTRRHLELWQAQMQRGQPAAKSPATSSAATEPLAALARQAASDRRFASAAWAESPIFDYFRQSYLLNGEYLSRLVEQLPVTDAQARERLRFMARQYTDAMSPSNFAATNPEFVKTALATQGASIQSGIQNLLADVDKGRISMTDEAAFEVGRNLATTAGAVVFENELMQLIQYAPAGNKVYARPLVIVPPCINKYYILDLQSENSLVRYAVEQGHNVFMISWCNPQDEQSHLRWDDYVESGVLQALAVAADIAKVDQVHALGFCVGGTLLTTTLAVAQARGEQPVAALTLLTTLLDFSEPGELGLFIDPVSVAAREASVGQGGLMKGSELAAVFSSLRANDLIWQYVVANYLQGKKPAAFDLLYWNSDSTNLPGPFAAWYLRNLYLENRLCQAGKLKVCNAALDLHQLDCPVFIFACREDHIVPWQAAYRSRALLGKKTSQTTFILGASGHIAGVINPPSKNKRSYWQGSSVSKNPQDWLDKAQEQRGSWWPAWMDWLKQQDDRQIKARKTLGNANYHPIEPAPGRYVHVKAS